MKDPGNFFEWLRDSIRQSRALSHFRQGRDVPLQEITAAVPCDDCHKCCTNGMEIPVFPDESSWLKTDEREGVRYLKHTEKGECAHWHRLKGKCMIYEQRPVLCRTYDCRVHLASHVVETEIEDVASQWDDSWMTDENRLILFAIHLAAVDTEKDLPGANSVIASDRGLARFPEYLCVASAAREEARERAEEAANDTRIILPGGPGGIH